MIKKKRTKLWIALAIAYALFVAPNTMIIRIVVQESDTHYWNLVRALIAALICTPFVIKYWHLIWNKAVRPWVILAATSMTVAILAYTTAIEQSQASYVAIMMLITPIVLVVLSSLLLHDKITHRAIAGITLAALGAMIIVFLPIAISQHGVGFYPIATVLTLVNSLMFSLAIISLRNVNEHHVPLPALLGMNAWTLAIVSGILFVLFGDHTRVPHDTQFFVSALYSGAGIAVIGRMLTVIIFEKVGPAFTGATSYLETFFAILLPVLILHEQLSIEMIVGGILILSGIYIIETHHHGHAKRYHTWHHH